MEWLSSRKLKTAIAALATILITAWVSGEPVDPDTVINAVAAIAMALIGSIAWEDAAEKRAYGEIAAAREDGGE